MESCPLKLAVAVKCWCQLFGGISVRAVLTAADTLCKRLSPACMTSHFLPTTTGSACIQLRHSKLGSVALTGLCSPQAQAFASWKDLVAYGHAKRDAMSDSVRRLLQGSLGRAFAAWSSRVHEKAALMQKAVHCLARLTHAHAASAFTAWLDWAAEQKDHRSACSITSAFHSTSHLHILCLTAPSRQCLPALTTCTAPAACQVQMARHVACAVKVDNAGCAAPRCSCGFKGKCSWLNGCIQLTFVMLTV